MAADENLTTSRLLNKLAHDIDTKAATITTAAGDFLLVYDISVGKVGRVALSSLTTSDLGAIAVPVVVGEDGTGYDVLFYSATAGKSWLWDESADKMIVTGATDLLGDVAVGVNGTGHDVNFYGDTAGQKFFWDQSADTAFLTCTVDIDGTVTVGVDDTGYDVKFFGATSGKSMLWDESADTLIVTGNLSVADTFTIGGTAVGATAAEINAAADVSARRVAVADANYQMLVANSGKPHLVANVSADRTFTFPTESDGLEYEFIAQVAAADGHDWIFDTGSDTNFFLGGVLFVDTDAGPAAAEVSVVGSDLNSNSKLQINLPNAGTRVKFVCDGTNWTVTGIVVSATAPAFADQ